MSEEHRQEQGPQVGWARAVSRFADASGDVLRTFPDWKATFLGYAWWKCAIVFWFVGILIVVLLT